MKRRKIAALLVSFAMMCSLFVGLTATSYAAADTATLKLEAYRVTNPGVGKGTFGAKIGSTEELEVGDEIIIAVQAYNFKKLVGEYGLNTVQVEVNYDYTALQQAMVASKNVYIEETTYPASGRTMASNVYSALSYVAGGSQIDGVTTEDYPENADEFDKELRWFNIQDGMAGASPYSASFSLKKITTQENMAKIIALVNPSTMGYSETNEMKAIGSGEDKKMLFAYKFVVKSVPASGNTTVSFETGTASALLFSAWNEGGSGSTARNYTTLTSGGFLNEVQPLTLNYAVPKTDAPTGTLTTYDTTGNKRTVNVTSDVTDTTIKVYADANKTNLIATGTKGSNSVDVARASAAGDSAIVKALNLGKVWITATKDGLGESNAVALTATARPNESKLTAAPTVSGSFSVKVNGAVTTAGLPTSITVPFTYNTSTGVETGTIQSAIPVTWTWTTQPTTAGTNAVAKATWGNAPAGLTKQADIDTYAPSVNVAVSAASYTGATATSPAAKTAKEAFEAGWKTEAELATWLNANVKVNTTKEGGVTAQETTTWTKTNGTFDVKGGTYTYESAAFGDKKATITVKVTPVTGELGPRAKNTTIEVTALDEDLNVVERPTTNDALIALAPVTANVYYGETNGTVNLSWTVDELKAGDAALSDGDELGTLVRTVTLPADLAWLTVSPNAAPDKVKVIAKASVGGIRATAANMPGTDNDMIRVKAANQEEAIMQKLVAKAGAIIEVYDSKEATEPTITHTVTDEEAAAGQVLFTTDNFKTAGSTRYVGINYNGMKTPGNNRITMTVATEPAVTFTGTATSVREGSTVTETASLNGAYTFVADSQTWTSSADATLTATANADKATATIRGIAAGTATVTFTAKVAHPFAEELLAADPDADNTEVEVTATKAYSVSKQSQPSTPSTPSTGTRPGTSSRPSGGVVIVPSDTQYFIDIDNITWAKDKINALAERGIVEGVADKIFAPNNTVTRAEFAKMIVGAFGIYDTNATMDFVDTVGAENEWYYKYVASAAKRGIILGYEEDHTFRPTRTITREEMCAIVVRACKATGRTLVQKHQPITFDDDASIMGYAKESVDLMTGAGIVDGMGENMFVPKGSATRAQAAKIIYDVTIG